MNSAGIPAQGTVLPDHSVAWNDHGDRIPSICITSGAGGLGFSYCRGKPLIASGFTTRYGG